MIRANNVTLLFGKRVLFDEVNVSSRIPVPGAFAVPILGLTNLTTVLASIGVGALIKVGKEYKASRTKVLREKSLSWLYLVNKRADRFDPRKIVF